MRRTPKALAKTEQTSPADFAQSALGVRYVLASLSLRQRKESDSRNTMTWRHLPFESLDLIPCLVFGAWDLELVPAGSVHARK